MPDVPQYGKVYTIETFYEGKLSSQKQEVEIQKATSKHSFLKDIIDLTTDALNGECKEIVLTITSGRSGVKMITATKSLRHDRGERFSK